MNEENAVEETTAKEIVIDVKWHEDRVREILGWIEFAKDQIKWHKEGIAYQEKCLEEIHEWLAEATKSREEFLAREAR